MADNCLICGSPQTDKVTILSVTGKTTITHTLMMPLDGYCKDCLTEIQFGVVQGIWDAIERLKQEQDAKQEGGAG